MFPIIDNNDLERKPDFMAFFVIYGGKNATYILNDSL